MSSFDDAKFHGDCFKQQERVFEAIVCVDAYRLNSGRAFLMHLTRDPILYINKLYRMCPSLMVLVMTHKKPTYSNIIENRFTTQNISV